jgi:hypothetical protein
MNEQPNLMREANSPTKLKKSYATPHLDVYGKIAGVHKILSGDAGGVLKSKIQRAFDQCCSREQNGHPHTPFACFNAKLFCQLLENLATAEHTGGQYSDLTFQSH